jgi:tRNA(fMet)-specific endonuclease VapC
MAPRLLLHTNTASYIIKGNNPGVERRLAKVPIAEVALSVISEAELRFGVARLPQARRLQELVENFLSLVTVLPWDSECAVEYGSLRAHLEREGRPLGNLDMMIAAHVLATGLTLVTNDRAFSRIKRLKVENWAD